MLVTFLQRFGLLAPSAANVPLKSRAGQNARSTTADSAERSNTAGQLTPTPVLKSEGHPQATAQRRQDVKTPAKKSKTPVKLAAKTVAKPAAKKPMNKVTAEKMVKPVTLKKALPVKKSTTKEFINTKPIAKSVIKPVVPPAAKPVPKSPSVKVAPLSAAKAASLPTKPVRAPQPAAPPVPKTMITPPPALKPGRRSSARTAAMSPPPAPMVPTHAPDAAKASYSAITERVISPPPHVAARKDPKLANNWKTKEASDLTDEEVKAMPDSEYMNDKQLAFFRHKLSILKSEIHASAGQTTENLREDTVVVPDPADRATIEEEHALELRTRDRERKLLKKIEQSISRIDAGDYGYCDETGEAIGVGRLIARPTASLSLEAQQRRELKQKLFGD